MPKIRDTLFIFSIVCLLGAAGFAGWMFSRYRNALDNWGDNYFRNSQVKNNTNVLESYYIQRYAGDVDSTQIDVQKKSNKLVLNNYDLQNKLDANLKLQLTLPNYYLDKQLVYMQFDSETSEPLKTETFGQIGEKVSKGSQVQVEIANPLSDAKPYISSLIVYEFL